jgi:hypothetical protein
MSTFDRLERQLPELMADLASARVPDYFDDLLQATARTRQRPAWASLERWIPVDLTMPAPLGRARLVPRLALLLLIGVLAVAAVLVLVGSHQTRLPPPFGPAANGLLYFEAANGDVVSADPVTLATRTIMKVPAANADGVMPSRNGRSIILMSKVAGVEQLSIANLDGSNLRVLPGSWTNFSEIDVSPNDAQIAIVSDIEGVPSISIIEANGSSSRSLNLGLETHSIWYLPDGRLLFQGSTTTGVPRYGIYTVNTDGTGLQLIGKTDVVNTWLSLMPSQDGKRLVYHKWVDAPREHGRLHVIDIASGIDTMVQVAGTTPSDEFLDPTFSRDGKSILFKWFTADQAVRLAVVPSGGGTAVLLGPAVHADVPPDGGFSPDDKSVMAWYPSLQQLWLLDPTGRVAGDRKLSLPVTGNPPWQRLAP